METLPIFEDDIVEMIYQCKKNGTVKRKVGTILESSQNISSDEEDEDDSLYQSLRKNTVRVAWHPSGKTEVIEEVKLNILERSLLPGDIVTKLSAGQESQKGYVTNCRMSCVLQCLTQPFIIFDVDSSLLVDFLPFRSEHQQVYMDGWVGSVDKISERLVLKFPDGAKCQLNTDELIGNLTEFYDVNDKRDKSSEFFTHSFYAGQLLKGQLGLLEGCTWLEQTKGYSPKAVKRNKNKTVVVCVEELEVSSVDVMWMCRGYSEAAAGEEINKHPPTVISGKDLERLKVLDYFEACDYALGSKAFYTTRVGDRIIPSSGVSKDEVRNEFISKFYVKKRVDQEKPLLQNAESDCLSSTSKISTNSDDQSNISLPFNIEQELREPNANLTEITEKLASVSRKTEALLTNKSQTSICSYGKKHKHQRANGSKLGKKKRISQKVSFGRLGKKLETLEPGTKVPVEVIALHSNIEVLWQDGTRDSNIPSSDLLPVQYVDDLEFFPGDYVSPAHPMHHLTPNCYGLVQKVNNHERTCIVQWYDNNGHATSSPSDSVVVKEEMSVFDVKEHSDLKFRPGAIVVRVGGFEADQSYVESNCKTVSGASPAVGGQVLESGTNGHLLVHWADKSKTYCRPVDLFLITSDISDLESSEDESEYDSDDSETDKFSTKSGGSWEWETEEEVEDEEEILPCQEGTCDLVADKLKTDKQSIIKEMDMSTLERNISFFMAMKENLDQHLVTLESILGQEKAVELRKIVSNLEDKCETVTSPKHEASLPSLEATDGTQMSLEGACDFDGFMAVVLDISNLYKTMHRLENVKLINTWSTMKKYLEAVQDQMKKAKNYNLCRKTFAKAKQSFEINSKLTVESQARAKQDETEDEASISNGPQVLSISMLFKVFDVIQPEKTPYDIIRTFHAFIKSLLSEFEECRELCFNALQSKPKLVEVPFADVSSCVDISSAGRSDEVSQNISDIELSKEKLHSVSEGLLPASEAISDFLGQGFIMLDVVPDSHHFKKNGFTPVNPKTFFSSIRRETNLLKTCLPKGIHVRGFESRMDLFSSMIEGPSNTPYEDGLFFFDVQLSPDYPKSPPKLHYISYCSDRLNPNLYEDGKVCVSLLGTWSGRGTEIWNPSESNLLQVLVSIQGLILNPEPYYNEAGYEKQKGTQLGIENCRMYNEMAIIKMVQAMTKLVSHPCDIFEKEITSHMLQNSERFVTRLRSWTSTVESISSSEPLVSVPDTINQRGTPADFQDSELTPCDTVPIHLQLQSPGFPLFPVSKGFKMTLSKCLEDFISTVASVNMLSTDKLSCF